MGRSRPCGLVADRPPPLGAGASIVAGDFNLDPERLIGEAEREIWQRNVGEERRFRDLSPRSPYGIQYGTRRGSFGTAIDHFAITCELTLELQSAPHEEGSAAAL
jgi:hypothetical protein